MDIPNELISPIISQRKVLCLEVEGQIPPPAMAMADLRTKPIPDPYFPNAKQASSLSFLT